MPEAEKIATEQTEQTVAIEKPKELTTIERIGLLSDLANACRDPEIVGLMKNKPNGDRLYELFVDSVSREIEVLMNGSASVPQSMASAKETASQILVMMQRLGSVLSSIEQGPGMAVLNMLVQNLGGRMPPQKQQQQQNTYDTRNEVHPYDSGDSGSGKGSRTGLTW